MRRLLLLLPLLSLTLATPARASENAQLSIMMDDNQLIYSGQSAMSFAIGRMKALGVDYVRVSVLWSAVAQGMKKSARGHGDNPKAYPKRNWDRYDELVRAAQAQGVGVYFDVTGPGPSWDMGTPPRSEAKYADTWEPDAKAFGRFVTAVGRRYSGTYKDENAGRKALPRVSFWAIYNEPNQPGWLTPQFKGKIPWSPVMYRDLWFFGRQGLDRSGHKDDIVLIGETAPLGNRNGNTGSPLYPKQFIREFFCADDSGRALGGAAAKARHCSTLKRIEPLRYTAWAHHPYTKKAPPTQRDPSPDAITIANIGELPDYLDRFKAPREGFAASNLVALTEFGYETNPPDPFSGVSLAKQAEWINVGDYLAYKQPRVIANTQFLLRDAPAVKHASGKAKWFNYQSGLFTDKGRPKPAAYSYRMPLVLERHGGGTATLWGWLRFLANGVSTEVSLQFKPAGGSYATVGDPVPVTNPYGFFEATLPQSGPGTWRASFTNFYNGLTFYSREIKSP